jgi:hypothetical protein
MSSAPTDLDGLRNFRALTTSESETGAEDTTSGDNEREGKTVGHRLLCRD